MANFDYNLNLYHPEKDHDPGSYEWWYFDGDLHNGYLFSIVFCATNSIGMRYIQAMGKLAADPTIPYNALDYATMKVGLMDANRNPIFYGEVDLTSDQIQIAHDRIDVHFGAKAHLTMRSTAGLPDFVIDVEVPDGKGNTIKADVVYSPMVPGVTIGTGKLVETQTEKGLLYHKWILTVPNADVKAVFKITDATGKETVVNESGHGYHDHNWGNHPLSATVKKWYWGRISEGEFNMMFAVVNNLVPGAPPYKPCFSSIGNDIITCTEAIDFVEDKVITGVQDMTYATEGRIIFNEGSGVKGEIKVSNLKMVAELICYVRFVGDYAMDIETVRGPIKREGKIMFEYMDLEAAVKLRKKMAAQQQ